ncbi:MAG: hypothetical protein IPM54_41315 [Polyangiaceae bacterium]|nr:hypothetical protein [Polyangiaceae bacterium]
MNGRKLGTLGWNVLRNSAVLAVMLMGLGCDIVGNPLLTGVETTCDCFCDLTLPGEPPVRDVCVQYNESDNVLADSITAACDAKCRQQPPGVNCHYAGTHSELRFNNCNPDNFQPEGSGAMPNSSDASLMYSDSIGTVTYAGGTPTTFHVTGDAAFTGGCEAGSCPIEFNRVYLVPDNFSIPTSVGTFDVTDALIRNNSNLLGTQSGRSFTIPSANVQMLVNGYVNGIQQSLVFTPTPGENLGGVHVPSTAEFSLFGHFTELDGDLTLTVNLNGTITARPPVANAGASQTMSCNPLTGTGMALLDGSTSSDPDGNLQTIAWYNGDTSLGTGITLSTELVVGTHNVTAYAIDSTGKFDSTDTTVMVFHDAPPVFDAPSSMTVPSCTPGLVILSPPEVIDFCSATSPTVAGEIVELNGVVLVTPIPVDTVTGAVALPSGTAIVVWTASTDGGTTTLEQTIEISSSADVSCCAVSQVLFEGTTGADSKIDPNASTGYCMFGYEGKDTLKSSDFADFISGGPGDDKLTSQGGDDVIFGDDGDDDITYQGNGTIVISGGGGNDKIHLAFGPTSQIFAGPGDDQVTCDGGNDTIYPGPGKDNIRAGSGDDTVIFYATCELDSRKLLNGGSGDDTLIIPVPLADLTGVTVVGFEHIVVDASQQHLAECP